MFYPLFSILTLWTVSTAMQRGPRQALWLCWVTALLLLPVWMFTRFGGLVLDLRTAAALGVLIGFALGDPKELAACFRRPVLGDFLVLAFIGVQIYSQYRVGPFSVYTAPEMLRRMLLPYLMGRLCLRKSEDLDGMLPLVARLCMILSVMAIFESVTKFHVVNRLLGKTYGLLEQGEGYRMGLKRAQGPLDHPIFFGMMLVMLYPWAIEAMRRAWAKEGPRWWAWLPLIMGGALFGTVSRGAQLAAIATLLVTLLFRNPSWRGPTVVLFGILAGLAYANKENIKALSAAIAGETGEDPKMILIDDEEEEYTGTTHRILLFKVYREAIERTGWFGFGYSLIGVPIAEEHEQRFGSIDNHYLFLLLQHGWAAIIAFLILAGYSLVCLIIAGWDTSKPESGIAGPMAGAMAGVLVLLFSVWFSPDFASVWLFNAGLASSLHCLPPSRIRQDEVPGDTAAEAARPLLRPRLTPGYAPEPTGEPA